MGLEVITDELIEKLLTVKKTVDNPRARIKNEDGNERVNFNLSDDEGNKFVLYQRQNTILGMDDDFSCGLSWVMPSGENFTLVRYNGPSHNHPNKIEGNKVGLVTHIHKSSKRYLEETGKADGYAEATTKYKTLEGAVASLTADCNIHGLKIKFDQNELF